MRLKAWLFFIGIAILNIFIYYSSFSHVARSDQLIYLANTVGIDDWVSLAVKTYSYDRVPHIFEGFDAVLFRPFFFFFLGTEKFFFGYNFKAWQITGVILHLGVIWNLLRLLWAIRPGAAAGIFTAFFSVLLVNIEMVIWHHINGYLIFLSCILIALYTLYKVTVNQQMTLKELFLIFFCLLISVATYELGLVYSVFFFIYLWVVTFKQKMSFSKIWYFIILLPGVMYVILNLLDLNMRHLGYGQGQAVLQVFHIFPTLKRAFMTMYWCVYSGLFPGNLETRNLQRTLFDAGNFLDWRSIFQNTSVLKWQVWSVIVLVGSYIFVVFKNWSWVEFKAKYKFIGLVFFMVLAQMFLIVMARINFKQLVEVLRHNAYYSYYFWMYFTIILYGIYSFQDKVKIQKSFVNIGLFVFMSIVIGINSYDVYQLNQKRAKVDTLRYFLVKNIEAHIKEGKETGEEFSFFLDPKIALNLPWVKRVGDTSEKKYSFLELIYPDYFNRQNPRYIYKLGKDGIKVGRRY